MSVPVIDSASTTWSATTPTKQEVYLLDIDSLLYPTPGLLDRGVMLAIEKHTLMRYGVNLADLLMGIPPFERPDFVLEDAVKEGIFYMIADAEESAFHHNLPRPGLSEAELDQFVMDVLIFTIHLRSHFGGLGGEIAMVECQSHTNRLIVQCQWFY